MSTMAKTTQPRRPRREFDDEFKAGAVRLVVHRQNCSAHEIKDLRSA